MTQVRYNYFETNSSSTMTFLVNICQVENLNIPSVVKLDLNGEWWKYGVNNVYANARKYNDEEAFFNLLNYAGVKQIYVDNQKIYTNGNNRHTKFDKPEFVLAKSFGNFKCFSEWLGHNDWDETQVFTKEQIKLIQSFAKDPNYLIICTDDKGNEVDWFSTSYSKMVIADKDIE